MKNEPRSQPREKTPLWIWLVFSLMVVILSSCRTSAWQPATEPKWVYTDLRILDASDVPTPEQDILAGYLRELGNELQIRLDFLDLNVVPTTDLYLALDCLPGGAHELPWHIPVDLAWDTLLVIPATGEIQVLGSDLHPLSGSGLRVVRDPVQDTVTISLIAENLPGKGLPDILQVFTTPAGSTAISDELEAFRSDGFPPGPVPVLLAFWDALPAYTPALGLRRWDGAHTGPLGGRHGLYNLLRTARARQIPIALLDLKTPTSLSALDYVDGLSMVQEMVDRGELILPDVQPGFIPDQSGSATSWLQNAGWDQPGLQGQNHTIATEFGLATSPFMYTPAGLTPELAGSSQMIFTFNPNRTIPQRTRWQQQVVLELPVALPSAAPTINGPDLAMRRLLIDGALSSANRLGADLVVLGGDLPASAWGNPEIARATFSYLVSHPWIRLLNGYALLGLPTPTLSAGSTLIEPQEAVPVFIQGLDPAPKNSLGEAARQAYESLYAPVYPHPAELPALRQEYSGIVEVLLTAARWAEEPKSVQDCSQDIDLDGKPECLLGSEQLLAVIQPENGELTFAFAIGVTGPHQLIGPGYQFISGLSEPETWVADAGFDSDPGAGSGAFREPVQPGISAPVYGFEETTNKLIFNAEDGGVRKIYQISEDQLTVLLELTQPARYELPLAFDPWLRFSPGWSQLYAATTIPTGWRWGLKTGPWVEVDSNMPMQLDSFLDSLDAIGLPEDPNQEHPEGHWLPFPMARLTIQAQNQVRLTISLVDAPEP